MTEPKQYEIDIASEYLNELLTELSSVLELQINFEVIKKNLAHSGWDDDTKGKAVIFHKPTQDTFILVDCYIEDPTDQIGVVDVIVRCSEKIEIVQTVLQRWYSRCWKRYKRSGINTKLINKYDSFSSLLNRIKKERIIIEFN